MSTSDESGVLGRKARVAVLVAAFAGLMFDGVELGLMPVAARSVTLSLEANNPELASPSAMESAVGYWFTRYIAALMLGAAVGGSLLGNLGDRIGRSRAMGVSMLVYSVFSCLGMFAQSSEQMVVLRFLVGLGVGGMWPNGVALVAECWPDASRPTVAGVLGAGINVGIVCLAFVVRIWPITSDSWRWIFTIAIIPAVVGLLVITLLPESPKWLASRGKAKKPAPPIWEVFRRQWLYITIMGILLSSVPLIGAWAGSKWMVPWAAMVGGTDYPGYKGTVQLCWALGATLGSFLGAPFAAWVGRRLSYFLISLGATALTIAMFQLTAPMEPSFLPIVFAQGLVATLFFGWLPLYLPELFPIYIRATGAGLSMNIGRFVTAGGVFVIGEVFYLFGNSYPAIGSACALIYALGMIVIFWAPNTAGKL
jgi:SHS family sialic acid transporter-like MFS transporter